MSQVTYSFDISQSVEDSITHGTQSSCRKWITPTARCQFTLHLYRTRNKGKITQNEYSHMIHAITIISHRHTPSLFLIKFMCHDLKKITLQNKEYHGIQLLQLTFPQPIFGNITATIVTFCINKNSI